MSLRTLPRCSVYGCVLLLCAAACDDDKTDPSSSTDAGAEQSSEGAVKARAGSGGSGGKSGSSTKSDNKAGGGGADSKSDKDEQAPAGKPAPAKDEDAAKGGAGGKPAASGTTAGASAAGSGGTTAKPTIERADLSNAKAVRYDKINALNGLIFAPDGKLYAVGEINVIDESKAAGDTPADKYKTSIAGHKLVVARFGADGAPDTSFGNAGFTIWEGPAGEATAYGLTLTDDGSVVVAANIKYASKRGGVALVKFDQTGKPVESFGDKGRKDLILGWSDEQVKDFPAAADGTPAFPSAQSWDIKAAEGGKLVVFLHESAAHGELNDSVMPAVQRSDNDRYIVRVNASDGEIDSEWNGGKPVVVNTPNQGAVDMQPRYPSDGGRRGIIEPDGSIVSVGYTNYSDDKGNQLVLIRVKPDGSFDEAFHKERPGQPVLPGVAVFNPVPEPDKGFAEGYGVVRTSKGYVTTGYGRAYGVDNKEGMSSLGYLPSIAVDMVSTRFTGTEVDTSYGRSGLLAAQSEALGEDAIETFEDRGRSAVVALPDERTLMGGRFGDYPALFVVTDQGHFDARIQGKHALTNGMLLLPRLRSDKQPATSMIYGVAVSKDAKRVAVGTNNHEQGALLSVLSVQDDGTLAPVK